MPPMPPTPMGNRRMVSAPSPSTGRESMLGKVAVKILVLVHSEKKLRQGHIYHGMTAVGRDLLGDLLD